MNKHLKNHIAFSFNENRPFGIIRMLANDAGAALVATLLFIAIMLALVPVAVRLTTGEIDRAGGFNENREAFFLAEAGLEHAKSLTQLSNPRTILEGPDGDTSTTSDNGTFGAGSLFTGPDTEIYNEVPFDFNGTNYNYYIRARDNNDDADQTTDLDRLLIVTAVGIVDDTTTTVEALIYNPPPAPQNAITSNGNLNLSPGSATISGVCGAIHANGNLDISGNPDIDLNATATGTYTVSGSPTVGGIAAGGQPTVPVPLLDPTVYQPNADYSLTSGGTVLDGNGDLVPGGLPGWSYSAPKWTFSGTTSDKIDASYYIDGDFVLSSSPGTVANPWESTFVATGFIEVSGNAELKNRKNPADPEEIQSIFMLAGTDLKHNGNPSTQIAGLLYAREQLQISGNPSINGAVMAYDDFAGDGNAPHGLVSQNDISGDVVISYHCGFAVPGIAKPPIEVVSWKEL